MAAKFRPSANQRAHFAIFIPNAAMSHMDLSTQIRQTACSGTIIHVVGEPLMAGYMLEIKRNYECSLSRDDLEQLIPLGSIDSDNIFEPPDAAPAKENITRSKMEIEAAMIPPPPRGQNIRAPIDGVSACSSLSSLTMLIGAQVKTKRCQEWTMEFLNRLVEQGLISTDAIRVAQQERDSPTWGIFGYKERNSAAGA